MLIVGRHRMTLLGTLDGDLDLWHQPARLVVAPGKNVVWHLLGHAATTIAVPPVMHPIYHAARKRGLENPLCGAYP
jgi:hypothetical protein